MGPEFSRVLVEVETALGERLDAVTKLRRIAAALQKLPGYTGVYFYELRGDLLHLVAHAGRDTQHVRIPVGEGICGLSARTRDAVIVEDVRQDPRYLACNLETQSEIVVPIMVAGRYLAQIDIDSDARAAFGKEDQKFLAGIAAKVVSLFPTA